MTDRILWIVALSLGFPLLTIAFGLLRSHLRRRGSPLRGIVGHVQNMLLPAAILYAFVVFVLREPQDGLVAQTLLTIVIVSALYTVLVFTAEVVFGAAPQDSWRARTPKLLRDIVILLLIGIGLMITLAAVWKQDVTAVATALGVGSVVLGFALQETLGNAMSGIALLMERPFQEGDFVEIDGVEGTVREINWRATRIENRMGDLVIIPHSISSSVTIVNNTVGNPSDGVLVELGFGYEHPPAEVKRVILDMLAETEGVLADPPPGVRVVGYGDSAVLYRVAFRVAHPLEKFIVLDRVMTRVWYAAQRAGLNIPFPIRTVHMHNADARPHDAAKSYALETASRVFAGGTLDLAALDGWARGAEIKQFTDGEVMIRRGEVPRWLYVVLAGEVELFSQTGASPQLLTRIGHGEIFGETTLLAGTRSPYDARAKGDASVLALNAEIVHAIARDRPAIAVQIGQIIDQRNRAAAAMR